MGEGSLDPVFVALWLWKDENSGQVKMMDGPNLGFRQTKNKEMRGERVNGERRNHSVSTNKNAFHPGAQGFFSFFSFFLFLFLLLLLFLFLLLFLPFFSSSPILLPILCFSLLFLLLSLCILKNHLEYPLAFSG
jgi:hypothetical protein